MFLWRYINRYFKNEATIKNLKFILISWALLSAFSVINKFLDNLFTSLDKFFSIVCSQNCTNHFRPLRCGYLLIQIRMQHFVWLLHCQRFSWLYGIAVALERQIADHNWRWWCANAESHPYWTRATRLHGGHFCWTWFGCFWFDKYVPRT